jgi:hypothetical protein
MLGFIIGLMIGTTIGVCFMALMFISKDRCSVDKNADKLYLIKISADKKVQG